MSSGVWACIVARRRLWPPVLLAGAALSAVMHNVLSAVFKTDEPVFFILTFLLAFAALVALIWVLVAGAARLRSGESRKPG